MADKKAWWDMSGWFGGGDSGTNDTDRFIQSPIYTDAAKKAVSDKLSTFLTNQVGQGATPYTGDITTSLDPLAQSRYNEYLGMDPSAWFKSAVTDPTVKAFREDILPEIDESWAGYQSGSGRGYDQTYAMNKVATSLGEVGAKAIPSVYESQLGLGYKQAALEQANKTATYTEWMRQQPEYSPVLEQALKYLSSGTETGETSYVKYLPPQTSVGSGVTGGGGTQGGFDLSSIDWSKLLSSWDSGSGGGGGGDWTDIFQNVYDWFGSW